MTQDVTKPMLRYSGVCGHIASIHSDIFFCKIDHVVISRTKAEKRKPPLKLKIIIKECFSNISVRRAGRFIPGV